MIWPRLLRKIESDCSLLKTQNASFESQTKYSFVNETETVPLLLRNKWLSMVSGTVCFHPCVLINTIQVFSGEELHMIEHINTSEISRPERDNMSLWRMQQREEQSNKEWKCQILYFYVSSSRVSVWDEETRLGAASGDGTRDGG